jgi:hypothetical protein
MLNENTDATKFSPVCFLETRNENGQIGKSFYRCGYLPKMQANHVINNFQTQQWSAVSKESQEKIQRYFNTEISAAYSVADTHTNRVKDTIRKIFDLNSIKSV